MPVEPEPTPRRTKPSTNVIARNDVDPLGVVPQPLEEELLLPLRRLRACAGVRYRGRGASIRRRAALAVLRTSCHVSSSSLRVSGFAVDHRRQHSFRRAAEHDRRCGVLHRMVGASRQRHHRQVGALSGRQGTDLLVESQSPCRIEGRQPQRALGVERLPGRAPPPGRGRPRFASPRRRRTRGSTPASRCRAPRARRPRGARPAGRPRSRAARSTAGSGRSGRRGRRAARSRAGSRSTQCAQSSSGPSTGSSVATLALPGRRHEHRPDLPQRPAAVLEPLVLVGALGEVRADGDAEREAPAVDVDRARVRRVRRDADPDERRLLDQARAFPANWRSASAGSRANTSR